MWAKEAAILVEPEDEKQLIEAVNRVLNDEELATDLDNALRLGVTIEKRSLAFYLEILKYTDSEEGKNALRKIIKEEKKHWEELKKLIK